MIVHLATRDMGLSQSKIWGRPMRPKPVEKLRSLRPGQGWRIDMTSFPLSDFTPLFPVTIAEIHIRYFADSQFLDRCGVHIRIRTCNATTPNSFCKILATAHMAGQQCVSRGEMAIANTNSEGTEKW